MPSKQARGKNLMDPSDEVLTGKRQGKGVFETIFDEEFGALKEKQLFARSKPTADIGDEKDAVTDVPPVSHAPYGDTHMKKEKDLKPIKDDPYENVVEAFIGLLEKSLSKDAEEADREDPLSSTPEPWNYLPPPEPYDPDEAEFYDPPSKTKESMIQDDASSDAKRMGLTHKGGGNYADKAGKITHHTVNGKLTPIVTYQPRPSAMDKPSTDNWVDRRVKVIKYNIETKKSELRQMQKELKQLLRLKKRENS